MNDLTNEELVPMLVAEVRRLREDAALREAERKAMVRRCDELRDDRATWERLFGESLSLLVAARDAIYKGKSAVDAPTLYTSLDDFLRRHEGGR